MDDEQASCLIEALDGIWEELITLNRLLQDKTIRITVMAKRDK